MTYRAHRVSRLQPSICLDSSVSWVMEFLINMFFTNLFQNLIRAHLLALVCVLMESFSQKFCFIFLEVFVCQGKGNIIFDRTIPSTKPITQYAEANF